MIGYAFTGSFCTLKQSLEALRRLLEAGYDVQPIMSENVYTTDTRFYRAEDFVRAVDTLCERKTVHTVPETERFGAICPLEYLIIAPCTGNTLAKIANGITDTSVTMAAKAHLRCDRPLLIAAASNDAMSQNLGNIAKALSRRSVYFLPMAQDDPKNKPHSLVADFSRLEEGFAAMREGRQLRPLFV